MAVLYLIGGPSRVGKSTVAERLHAETGASLITTDAIVWMLQVAAPHLGVRHGSETKPTDTAPYLAPFVEAATVYGARDLILEGDALSPTVAAELAEMWPATRGVFLGAERVQPPEVVMGGGYAAALGADDLAALVDHIRRRSQHNRLECARLGIPYLDLSTGRDQMIRAAIAVLT